MKINRLVLSLLVPQVAMVSVMAGAKPVSDDYINDSVRQKLAADQVVKGGAIEVEVREGAVILKGSVQDPKQKSKAERIARKVKGVKTVVNNIQIVHP
ncbi:MAG: BON domain-containing protein [Acidobacteriota bacterium]|nr:BON domain-containing protein [Acidobacteriota bacterium]